MLVVPVTKFGSPRVPFDVTGVQLHVYVVSGWRPVIFTHVSLVVMVEFRPGGDTNATM